MEKGSIGVCRPPLPFLKISYIILTMQADRYGAMQGAVAEVGAYLGRLFGFKYRGAGVYDYDDARGKDFAKMCNQESGSPVDFDLLMEEWNGAVWVMHNDGGRRGEHPYSLLVSGPLDDGCYANLGMAMTNAEHAVHHLGRLGSADRYIAEYSIPFRVMLGALAKHEMSSSGEPWTSDEFPPISYDRPIIGNDPVQAGILVGQWLANGLILNMDLVPYRSLFHVKDESCGWRTVAETEEMSRPRAFMNASERDAVDDGVLSMVYVSMGFRPREMILTSLEGSPR